MDRESFLVNILAGSIVFGCYELYGFEATVVLSLVLIIFAVGDIANQMQSDNLPTADDLK